MQHTVFLPQDLDEKLLVFLLLAEVAINQSTRGVKRAQGARGHLLYAPLFFHQQKGLENR